MGKAHGADKTESVADTLAIAAVVLAAGAFAVAFLQAILQYASSSQSRNKVSPAAIDVSSRHVKTGWSWRYWRLRVYYPLLYFSYQEILNLSVAASDTSIDGRDSLIKGFQRANKDARHWAWRTVRRTDKVTWRNIAYGQSLRFIIRLQFY